MTRLTRSTDRWLSPLLGAKGLAGRGALALALLAAPPAAADPPTPTPRVEAPVPQAKKEPRGAGPVAKRAKAAPATGKARSPAVPKAAKPAATPASKPKPAAGTPAAAGDKPRQVMDFDTDQVEGQRLEPGYELIEAPPLRAKQPSLVKPLRPEDSVANKP